MAPSKINILEAADRKIKHVFRPFIVGDVNDSQVKVAKFEPDAALNTGNADSALTVTELKRL